MMTATTRGTDAVRAPGARSRVPRMRDVLLEQLRVTGFALRVPIMMATAFAVLATVFLAIQFVSGDMDRSLHAQPSPLPGIIGALLPIAVWAREERFGPGFMWTLPVDRARHAVIKTMAGWMWLMGGIVLYALCQLVLAVVAGNPVLPVETLQVLPAQPGSFGPLEPAMLQTVRWTPGPLVWAVPFAAATAMYLLASAIVLAVRHPFRWAIGAVLAFPVLSIASHAASGQVRGLADAPERLVRAFVTGRYGLDAILTMRTASLDHRATLTTGERIHAWLAVPDTADWRIAALLWITAGLLALLMAASRHRERRRA